MSVMNSGFVKMICVFYLLIQFLAAVNEIITGKTEGRRFGGLLMLLVTFPLMYHVFV